VDADDAARQRPRIRPVEPVPVQTPDGEMVFLRDPTGLADEIAVSPIAVFIISMMDGLTDLTQIQAEFAQRVGQVLPLADLEELIAQLDARHLLDSPAFAAHEKSLTELFLAGAVRPAAFAGRCYPPDSGGARAQLDAYFTHADGPGGTGGRRANPAALVIPHIDPPRGGTAYAFAYRELADTPPARVIVLGTSHLPTGSTLTFTRKDYETPLGAVRTDRAALDRLEARFGSRLYEGEIRHRTEHSVEFQMLFLRHRWPDADFEALPVLCGSPHEELAGCNAPEAHSYFREVIEALVELSRERPTLVIASADLAHVGPQFGDAKPYEDAERAALDGEDRAMLAPALSLDREGFRRGVWGGGDKNRICGFMPIYATLALLERTAPRSRGSLLAYRQWPDPRAVVSYASVVYR
jgi:AmmeMemoRadiSam system protein B